MRNSICILLLAAALAVLPAGCDEGVTEPEEEETIAYGALIISYEADVTSAGSAEISPESGGSVAATGPDGVEYHLAVSPGAVESATTVTITPLRELSICSMDSSHVDTSDCIVGALFEPAGLAFDSTAVLTITYPESGLDCALNDRFCVVSLDSSSAFYEMIPTTIDHGVPSLTCTLSHFSGYGAHDPDYDYLEMQIEKYSEYGRDFPGDDILAKLMSLAAQASAMGWDDLRDLAWQGARPILDYLVNEAIGDANADPGEATLGVLIHYLGPAQAMGFTDIAGRLLQAINDVVVAVASRGRQLCQSGDEEAGSALLTTAYEWACAGLVLEISTRDTIYGWLIDCSGFEVLLVADKPYVNTAAASTYDIDGALLTFTVTVLDAASDPIQGCTVTVKWDGSGTWTGTTDPDGIFTATISGSQLGLGPSHCPPHSHDRTFYAEASSGGTTQRSNDLPIEIRDIQVTSNVSYTFNYSYAEGENSEVVSAVISGSGTGCWGLCEGTLTRSYLKVINNSWTCTAIGQLEIPACNFLPHYAYTQVSDVLAVAVVSKVEHSLKYLLQDIIMEVCEGTGECDSGEADMCYYLLDYDAWPCMCDPYYTCMVDADNDGSGNFQYLWEDSDSGPNWSSLAELSITAFISF